MLIFLARLLPEQWAAFNQTKPDGIVTYMPSGMIEWGNPPDLDGFRWSGLYRDAETDAPWVIQYTLKITREKMGRVRTEFYRCWRPNPPSLTDEIRRDLQELIEESRKIMMTVSNLDDEHAYNIYRDADNAAQGFYVLLAMG